MSDTVRLPTLDDIAALIRGRRTYMLVDRERAVPHDLVAELCELAQWAPNHKRTWPWRFALFEGDARARLGETIADAMATAGDPEAKVVKTRTKYLRTPATLVVGTVPGDSPLRTAENRDAGAAGMQNLLLGATAAGLATYWSSCAKGANDVVAELCGFAAGTHVLGLVYLGWPTGSPEVPTRPPAAIRFLS
ncbi:MAG: putative oxidoreductase [Ilumatobacteraceae bacterium]|nr:putative oxidoreductase [Ilumatobacteraceae bacterium]